MVHEPSSDSLVHGRILFAAGFDVEEFDQWFDGDALDEDSPVDHSDGRCYEHGSVGDFLQF